MPTLKLNDTVVPDSVIVFTGGALGSIAAHCDGAREQDGQGFSKAHAGYGSMLAMLPGEVLADEEDTFLAAADLLMHYPRQVANFAGNLDDHPDWQWLKANVGSDNRYLGLPEARLLVKEDPSSPIGVSVTTFLRNKRQVASVSQLARMGQIVGAYRHEDGHRFDFSTPAQMPVLASLIESRLAAALPAEDLTQLQDVIERLGQAVERGVLPLSCKVGQAPADPVLLAPNFEALRRGKVVLTLDSHYDPDLVYRAKRLGGSYNPETKQREYTAKDLASLLKLLQSLEQLAGERLVMLTSSDWAASMDADVPFSGWRQPGFDEEDDPARRLLAPMQGLLAVADSHAELNPEAAPDALPENGPRGRLVTAEDGRIFGRVHLPFEYRDTKDDLKPLGARFHWDTKDWVLEINDQNLADLKAQPIRWETPLDEFFAKREVPPFGYLEVMGDYQIRMATPYHPDLVAFIRNEIDRADKVFDGASKTWTFRASTAEVVGRMRELMRDFRLKLRHPGQEAIEEVEAEKLLAQMEAELRQRMDASYVADSTYTVPGFKLEPFPFQKAGMHYVKQFGNSLIADDCGLGKTPQAIGALLDHGAFPALIACPSIARLSWESELQKFTDRIPPNEVVVLGIGTAGQKARALEQAQHAKVVIINYDILSKHAGMLSQIPFKGGVMDESHYAKTPDAQRTLAAKQVMDNASMELKLLLSATPYMNRPSELIPQLEILGKLEAVGGAGYLKRLDGAGPAELERLKQRLRSVCMIRREKRQVWAEMPQVLVGTVPCQASSSYLKAERDLAERIIDAALDTLGDNELNALQNSLQQGDAEWAKRLASRGGSANGAQQQAGFTEISRLRHLLGQEKTEPVLDWLRNFRDATAPNEKVVIFAYHKDVQKALFAGAEKLGMKPAWIGDQEATQRKAQEARFQTGDARVCIASMKAARENITLTAASHCLFAELDYSGGVMIQCRDRIIRISQQAETVNVNFASVRDSLDVNMVENIQAKMAKITTGLGDFNAQDGLSAESSQGTIALLVSRYRHIVIDKLDGLLAKREGLPQIRAAEPELVARLEEVLARLALRADVDLEGVVRSDNRAAMANNIRLFDAVTVDLGYFPAKGLALLNIVVDRDLRGRGLGHQALERVLATADALDLPIHLYARAHDKSPLNSNDLSAWYERHGFNRSPGGHHRPAQGAVDRQHTFQSATPALTESDHMRTHQAHELFVQ